MLLRRITQQLGYVGLGTAAAAILAGSAAPPTLADGTAAVSMTEPTAEHYAFTANTITVPAGTTVNWTNATDAPHTVTSDAGAFGSGLLNQNQTFRFSFASPGTYNYHCTVHPYMHGSIVVTSAPAAPAPAPAAPTVVAPAAAAPAPAPVAPARVPTSMPGTGGGGGALLTEAGAAATLLGALCGLVAAARRRK